MPKIKGFSIGLAGLMIAQAFVGYNAAAQEAKTDAQLATDINNYIIQQNLRDAEPEFIGPTISRVTKDISQAPQTRVRPRALSGFPDLPNLESESKQRALRALDDVIQQDVLRERRFPLQ